MTEFREPPSGWYTFGTHAGWDLDDIPPLVFSEQLDEAGMPLWERVAEDPRPAKLAHEETPDDGHTFRITVEVRGASRVVGEEHARDDSDFMGEPWAIEVREHNLKAALGKAARVPFAVWAESAPE